ncbi:DUF6580 family putative transport protein [Niabella insulamsoli]|uniref:DUF6580 family putative transport protein n=1 Tax=Niabella insulamsoli TaxID=3144874 RepID=UPI0031FC4DC7
MAKLNSRSFLLIIMILLAALSRLLPHPYNFTPLVAIGLFGGAHFRARWQAFVIPIAAYLISDVILQLSGRMGVFSFTQPFVIVSQCFVYAGMLLVTLLGTTLNGLKPVKILGYSLTGSAIFWMVSNLGVWVGNLFAEGSVMHEPGLTLGMTYLRALPFYNTMSTEMFVNAFLGDIFYCTVLFGGFALVSKRYASLRYNPQ